VKTCFECYPCFLRQAIEASRATGADEATRQRALIEVLDILKAASRAESPPAIAGRVHRAVRAATGCDDPYRAGKERSARQALGLYGWMRGLVAAADDPLSMAVHLSVAGNIIDFALPREFDLKTETERVLTQSFHVNDLDALRAELATGGPVLFLADNAGETVYDRILIEVLKNPVRYAVKSGPVLNDAVHADAEAAGIEEIAEIVETGSDSPGTFLDECSPAFLDLYRDAPLVIAKGQANFETLSHLGDPRLFFLLQTKCPIIARAIRVPCGTLILARGDRGETAPR